MNRSSYEGRRLKDKKKRCGYRKSAGSQKIN